ncbi:DUF6515 family protein [Microbulbifer hainanensis]|uniref:DUF6515 family protein n=1 Tax=Microbulbifer hainanensis TaxID=2735675 RepID=UPI0018668DA5|nr:DUF6515 family protein [Microbulbifer hainanensis]
MRMLVAISTVCLTLVAGSVWADDTVKNLPYGTEEVQVQGRTYYYAGGYFYRAVDDGYLRVEAPLGATVALLPSGSSGFTIGAERYFVAGNGIFFRYSVGNSQFTVVTPPYNWRNYYRNPNSFRVQGVPRAHPHNRDDYGEGRQDSYPVYYAPYPTYGTAPSVDGGQDARALREATCRQIASDLSRRNSATGRVDSRKLRIYRDEYQNCLKRGSHH